LTGTFAAPRNGIKLWNNGGGGALLGRINANGANTARLDKERPDPGELGYFLEAGKLGQVGAIQWGRVWTGNGNGESNHADS
jgi:hypothetical protein